MDHETRRMNEIDLEGILQDRGVINILVTASYFKETEIGKYKCLLLCDQNKKYGKLVGGAVENVKSANQTSVMGLIEAVKHIKLSGTEVRIISGISLGFKNALKNKGLYEKAVNELLDIVKGQGNTLSSIAILDGMDAIKKIVNSYGDRFSG